MKSAILFLFSFFLCLTLSAQSPTGSLLFGVGGGFNNTENEPKSQNLNGSAHYFLFDFLAVGVGAGWAHSNSDFGFGETRTREWFYRPGVRLRYSLDDNFVVFLESGVGIHSKLLEEERMFPNGNEVFTTSEAFISVNAQPGLIYYPVPWLGFEGRVAGFTYSEEDNRKHRTLQLGLDNATLGFRFRVNLTGKKAD